jgi:thiol-disulfide isomerase/thioredoxin
VHIFLDEDDFEALRQKRKIMLQKKMKMEQDWKQLGHGRYRVIFPQKLYCWFVNNVSFVTYNRYMELTDTKEFFNAAKKSQKMIAHFYRSVTPRCQIVDAHMERLAQQHLEARFVKIDAEKNPFLVERLGIILMPTIVLIKDGKTEHAIHGFDEFGGSDDFTTSDMAYVLATHNVLHFEVDRSEEIASRSTKAGLNSVRLATVRAGEYDHLSDDELFNDD